MMFFLLVICQIIIGNEKPISVRGPLICQECKPGLHKIVEEVLTIPNTNKEDYLSLVEYMLSTVGESVNARYRNDDHKATTVLFELQKYKPYRAEIQETAQAVEEYLVSKGAVAGFSIKVDRNKIIVPTDQATAVDDIQIIAAYLDKKLKI